jgi:hypothetical protein
MTDRTDEPARDGRWRDGAAWRTSTETSSVQIVNRDVRVGIVGTAGHARVSRLGASRPTRQLTVLAPSATQQATEQVGDGPAT